MAIPQVSLTNSFNDWRLITNQIATAAGDFAGIYNLSLTDSVSALNDLEFRKFNKIGGAISGNTSITGTFGVTGGTTLTGTLAVSSDVAIGSNKFNVTASSGNTSIAGTLSVSGTTGLGVVNVSGATAFTLSPTSPTPSTNDNSTKLATTAYYIGQAGTASPIIDGNATVGTSYLFARQDHVHPTDTTRAPVLQPTFTNSIAITGGTVTTSTPFLSATQTWNNAATAFNGVLLNVTNTASNVGSLLLNFQLAGQPRFGVDVNGAVIQKLTFGVALARDLQPTGGEPKHIREYQDLDDAGISGVQGLDVNSVSEFSIAFNAAWNGSSYIKDSALAGDHTYMERLTEGFTKEWWFSDGTTATPTIAWVKRISFNLITNAVNFYGTLGASGATTLGSTLAVTGDFSINSSKFNVTASSGNTTIAGTLGVTGLITGSISGNAGTVTNGVYTSGSYADPTWITSLAKSKIGLGSVENTALSTWTGTSNITTLGTIGTGTWNATAIGLTKGGTGLTSAGAAYQIYGMNAAASAIEWKTITSSDSTITIDNTTPGVLNLKTSGVSPGTFTSTGDFSVGSPVKFQVIAATGNTTISGLLNVAGDVNINSNKFNITGTNGNTSIAGTLSVAGVSTLAAASATAFTASTSVTSPIVYNGEVATSTAITTTTATAQTPIATVAIATYRSAIFEVQATDTTGSKWHRVSINAIQDGTNINSAEYGGVILGSSCATFDFDINSGSLRLLATPSSTNSTTFKVYIVATKI